MQVCVCVSVCVRGVFVCEGVLCDCFCMCCKCVCGTSVCVYEGICVGVFVCEGICV